MPREILVNWVTPGGPAVTVLNFDDSVSVAAQRAAVDAMLSDFSVSLSSSVTWTVATEGAEFAETTGNQTGYWGDATPYTGSGGSSNTVVPDATQMLLRWRTLAVVAGRRVQGRTFIPGLVTSEIAGGNIAAPSLVGFQAIAEAFATSGVGFSIYSRPAEGRIGSLNPVTSGSVWSELAVQRKRRG